MRPGYEERTSAQVLCSCTGCRHGEATMMDDGTVDMMTGSGPVWLLLQLVLVLTVAAQVDCLFFSGRK